ncbi:MAG TPA: FAD-binding protein [Nodularia sp. (in: cyanobacteria)]|nr:FAD-binding protein [Nodularia sp. (in: cyanobacteria)]
MNHILPDLDSCVVVVGGGIAGIWAAYKLINVGIPTTLITYLDKDRGGIQGSTNRSVGAINTSPLTNHDFASYMDDLGRKCTHPFVTQALQRYLKDEIDELSSLVALKPIKIGLALESTSGRYLLQYMYEQFNFLGGRIINAWVTRLIVDKNTCQGLQYETNGYLGKLRCRAIILASGGYTGLYSNSINTSCFGTILGRFMECGGTATNLEFLFQHGYGNIDTNDLTPTEEIAGAEIYDKNKSRVVWLEKMLFDGQGTNTHLQAVNLWKSSTDYFIDLSYRKLYLACYEFNSVIQNKYSQQNVCHKTTISEKDALEKLLKIFPEPARIEVLHKIVYNNYFQLINYEKFQEFKKVFPVEKSRLFQVKPITYFSMGGIAHINCRTNLKNVYVTGECMHDFGANRIGGLPWALYLVSGRIIRDHIVKQLQEDETQLDFDIVLKKSHFNWELLKEIRERLYEYENKNENETYVVECMHWFRKNRSILIENNERLSDAFAWLIVAEAIMQASSSRRESRGYFLRSDFPFEDENLNNSFSYLWYDQKANAVKSRFLEASYFTGRANASKY